MIDRSISIFLSLALYQIDFIITPRITNLFNFEFLKNQELY